LDYEGFADELADESNLKSPKLWTSYFFLTTTTKGVPTGTGLSVSLFCAKNPF
jgi:hypothetical protein